MFRPLMWASSGWWEQAYNKIIMCLNRSIVKNSIGLFFSNSRLNSNITIQMWIATCNYMRFNCGVIPIHNFNYILILTALKIATWVAATCLWLLCNKIIFMNHILYTLSFAFYSCILSWERFVVFKMCQEIIHKTSYVYVLFASLVQ